MFKPNFKYTHSIVNNLTSIAVARELILNSPLIPKWDVSLRREAIIRSAHSSTSIEGNRLSLEQVSDLASGREVTATRKDKQEVLNYLSVLENINKSTDGKIITEKNLLVIHKSLTHGTLENLSDCGVYRKRYVVVGNRVTGDIFFRPPSNEEVPGLVRHLIEWLNSPDAKTLDPVIEAGIAHYELVRIHPFVDGNGRCARALATLILYMRGFDAKQFFCLDDYYDSDRSSYHRVLQSIDQKTLDLTPWLEYFVFGVSVSLEAVKERVLRLSSERLRRTKKGQIALNERQMKIVEHIVTNSKITSAEIQKMYKISRQAVHKEIDKLIKLDVIEPKGAGKTIFYILK